MREFSVPAITEILNDLNAEVLDRVAAAKILGAVGPDARSAVPALTAASENKREDSWVRRAAQKALAKIEGRQESRPGK